MDNPPIRIKGVPPAPAVGFIGREEMLRALTRALDAHHIVLLHGAAGSGKTTTAAEFARRHAAAGWNAPILFTSFRQYRSLPALLDLLAGEFDALLQESGVDWLALNDLQRYRVALQILEQFPVLWIWDQVEEVTEPDTGTEQAWSEQERQDLVTFLDALASTQARIVLLSRSDGRGWLGDRAFAIPLTTLSPDESGQLIQAIAAQAEQSPDLQAWIRLVDFARGRPFALTLLAGQALRDGLTTRPQVEAFVAEVGGQTGTLDVDSTAVAYLLRSLTEDEARTMALVALFQGFVDVEAICVMGHPEMDWCLPEVRGYKRATGVALFDRVAACGLLTPYGETYYAIHPAMPSFLKGMFDRYYPGTRTESTGLIRHPSRRALQAYVYAMGELGEYYYEEYEKGNRDAALLLTAEERNLLHARRFARLNNWQAPALKTTQGLLTLYRNQGRRAEWGRLARET